MPNTAKQEAIRKAYGEYWEQLESYQQEEIIENDGRFYEYNDVKKINDPIFWVIKGYIDCIYDFENDYLIPSSIENISTNNGWIRIKSEEDLPKASIEAHFILINGDIETGIFDLVSNTFQNVRREYFLLRQITHYQPILNPDKPIY